jgi:hypothetical protein
MVRRSDLEIKQNGKMVKFIGFGARPEVYFYFIQHILHYTAFPREFHAKFYFRHYYG